MKKILLMIGLGLIFIPLNVKAVTNLPFTVKDNNSEETQLINVEGGNYSLPTFCSTGEGCTLEADSEVLQKIGKYYFGSGSEYFYIIAGGGAKIYEEAGPNPATPEEYKDNFNKIVINASEFLDKESVTIGIGADKESRSFKLIATKVASDEEKTTEFNPYLAFGIGGAIGIGLVILIVLIAKNKSRPVI